ncbi:YolD-like family protein [Paenibacillus eucommiae]|uniref:YolD-like family protein n=1 Tax=Paenibacillus eucommiae TaxID=1355755 RepID=A0ABS4IYR5_9BACL|nr:YolD-like family protein [Paenibacillus eucommiae]MBP1992737.1 hypothetical protein [Paenibacillus eucommiae]
MFKDAGSRPTRDELVLEEIGNQLVEAKEENSEMLITVWGSDPVTGRIVDMDARTQRVHVQKHGEITKIPFLDIMKVESHRL